MILGLDMSSKKTGYSLFDDDLKLIDYGCWEISFDDEGDWRKRILYMSTKLNDYFYSHKIDRVVIEDAPPISENTQTVKVLSALQGSVMAICNIHGFVPEFYPNRWKTKIGIDLTHSKEFKDKQKEIKIKCGGKLSAFKKKVKQHEKKMSIDYANYTYDLNLLWKSYSSDKNDDDIADSICLVTSVVSEGFEKYNLDNFNNILDTILLGIKDKKEVVIGRKPKM